MSLYLPGVCVDTGADMTYIVPCWEGSPLPNATLILKLGGKHITDRLLVIFIHFYPFFRAGPNRRNGSAEMVK